MRPSHWRAVLILSLSASPADAAVYVVKPDFTGDFPTIQYAIDQVTNDDEIHLVDGTYSGVGFWDLDFKGKRLTLRSQTGSAAACILDLQVQPGIQAGCGAGVTLEGLTLQWGRPYAVSIDCSAELTVRNCRFLTNRSNDVRAGAIRTKGTGSVLIESATFLDNIGGTGGAIYHGSSGSLTLTGSHFERNWGGQGGAVYVAGPATITNSTFHQNQGGNHGGAIRVIGTTCEVMQCTFSENFITQLPEQSLMTGGAISAPNTGVTIQECTFLRNRLMGRDAQGGAVFLVLGAISKCQFTENRAEGQESYLARGGAIYVDATMVEQCDFVGNSAVGPFESSNAYGGAVLLKGGTLSECLLSDNRAPFGGGVACEGAGGTITNCTIVGNAAHSALGAGGGGVFVSAGSPSVTRSIIAFNEGQGGLGCQAGSPVLTCTDIFGNEGGDWTASCIAWQAAIEGNFSEDPLFHDLAASQFELETGSPCTPGANPRGVSCGLLGARMGAETTVVPTSWSQIKALLAGQ